jgi:hypothetical protein
MGGKMSDPLTEMWIVVNHRQDDPSVILTGFSSKEAGLRWLAQHGKVLDYGGGSFGVYRHRDWESLELMRVTVDDDYPPIPPEEEEKK